MSDRNAVAVIREGFLEGSNPPANASLKKRRIQRKVARAQRRNEERVDRLRAAKKAMLQSLGWRVRDVVFLAVLRLCVKSPFSSRRTE
jgi:hypothetical protein